MPLNEIRHFFQLHWQLFIIMNFALVYQKVLKGLNKQRHGGDSIEIIKFALFD